MKRILLAFALAIGLIHSMTVSAGTRITCYQAGVQDGRASVKTSKAGCPGDSRPRAAAPFSNAASDHADEVFSADLARVSCLADPQNAVQYRAGYAEGVRQVTGVSAPVPHPEPNPDPNDPDHPIGTPGQGGSGDGHGGKH